MNRTITVAVDAMGGDNAPDVVLQGVEAALAEDESLEVILCGPADIVEPFCENRERCSAVVCTEVIAMDEHPAKAVQTKKDSSIVVGCRQVKEGAAQGFFSAGSTGACLAASTLVIGRIKGVARPALCTIIPCPSKPVVMCDVGANADCKPAYLVQFGQMASIYIEKMLDVADPKVHLLNIGSEDTKGSAFAQECHALLKTELPNFAGNCEGTDLLTGACDVVVTDGFTGNVCIKTIEGTASVLFGAMKDIFYTSLKTKLAASVLKDGLKALKDSTNPDTYGGAPILGVKGVSLVGHGSSGPTAIKNGILSTAKAVRVGVSEMIAESVAAASSSAPAPAASASAPVAAADGEA